MSLSPVGAGMVAGAPHAGYANMVGPYGGVTAAQMLQAVWLQSDRLGEPLSLTVNFCAAVADAPFTIHAEAVVTNRSTQHWMVVMRQSDKVVSTATVVCAVRRPTWADDEVRAPDVPAPEQTPVSLWEIGRAFVDRYEWRVIEGGPAAQLGQTSDHSRTSLWLRDAPARAIDYASLTSMADGFFPRIYLRRGVPGVAGTMSMTVHFHASAQDLAEQGSDYVLARAQGQAFRNGYFDHHAHLWGRHGKLLATTSQVVYFKD